MTRFCDLSISRKLSVVSMVTTVAALLFMSVFFIGYDYMRSKRDAIDHLASVGRMIAANSTAALAFDDAKSADEVLNTLREEPEIQAGCTYGSSGEIVAEYHSTPRARCPAFSSLPYAPTVTAGAAMYRQSVLLGGAPAGYVYLESSLADMRERRMHFLLITGIFALGGLGLTTLVGNAMRRWITRPIVSLVSLMEKVSSSRDYGVRASASGNDEVARLVVGFNHMLGEIQHNQTRLEHQALHDDLTGLPNRRLLGDRLSQTLARAQRQETTAAVLYLDLDGFKLVNDTLGHSTGDLLLRQVAGRLRCRLRKSDTLARLGGDEFAVVAGDIQISDEAAVIARDLLLGLAEPFQVNGHSLTIGASLGVSLFPQDAFDAELLLQQADTAMYVAKGNGKNQFMFFTAEFGDAVRERLQLDNQLHAAVEDPDRQFVLHFQPEFDVHSSQLRRFEALVRWEHPTLGLISPGKFIPIAEESGLIVPLGEWVLEKACTEALKWQAFSESPVQVAVNVSTLQFLREDFVDCVHQVVARTGLPPSLLQLELTESVMISGIQQAEEKMRQLQALGLSLAIDDFGTGYSSLSYLPHLPFNLLKIDRSFLTKASESSRPQDMIQSVVDIAHKLKMSVVVEGVETPEQVRLLYEVGCDEVQGFAFGRPTPNPYEYLQARPVHGQEAHMPAAALDVPAWLSLAPEVPS